jgi:protein-L-isoaspartate(D-aspartate) O-methyltransferase
MDPHSTVAESPRAAMVRLQLVRRGIRDRRVLEAMGRVPRERFVPPQERPWAYEDRALPIGCAQTISQPYMVALTLEALCLEPGHRVLEVGTGSGYMTALLSSLVREVVSIEVIPELAASAGERLRSLGCGNVAVLQGDGSLGHPAGAPFDRIAVGAGGPSVPNSLVEQLGEGGILVIPVGSRSRQDLKRVLRTGLRRVEEDLCPCVYVPLVGAEGWGRTDADDDAEEEGWPC